MAPILLRLRRWASEGRASLLFWLRELVGLKIWAGCPRSRAFRDLGTAAGHYGVSWKGTASAVPLRTPIRLTPRMGDAMPRPARRLRSGLWAAQRVSTAMSGTP
jgi:hypothetical protein